MEIAIYKEEGKNTNLAGVIPKVTISNVPIPAQNLSFHIVPGVTPKLTEFWTHPQASEELEKLINPVVVTIDFPTNNSANNGQPSFLVLQNMYLVSRSWLNKAKIKWSICDVRWLLQGKKIYSVYNKTILQNSQKTAFAGESSPADLRKYFESISEGRYISWTVKADGKPYSIKEILEIELKKIGIEFFPLSEDLSFTVDNLIYNGMDLSAVLEELLDFARMSLGVTNEGKIYAFSLTQYDKNFPNPIDNLKKTRLLGGILYSQQKKKARPTSIKILFEKKIETLFVETQETRQTPADGVYKEPLKIENKNGWFNDDDKKKGRVIGCVNVLPVPYAALIDGINRNPGEYVPISLYLKAFGLTIDFMAGIYFQNGFEMRFRKHMQTNYFNKATLSADEERQVLRIASVIKENYCKTYMIDPYYRDRMKLWEARLATVINNYDHHTTPSPVFADYFYLPIARNVPPTSPSTDWYSGTFSHSVDIDDPYLMQPVPAQISVLSMLLGIFSVDFKQPLDPSTGYLGKFAVDNLPLPNPKNLSYTIMQTTPKTTHNMLTIMSVVWEKIPDETSQNPIKDAYYAVEYKPANAIGEFPSWEIVCNKDYARINYPKITLPNEIFSEKSLFGLGYKIIANALKDIVINKNFLEALASYEASRLYQQFCDLYAGIISVPGLKTDLFLTGNMVTIAYTISPKSGATTTFQFLDTVPYPSLEASGKISQKYIDYIKRNIAKPGDALQYNHVAT